MLTPRSPAKRTASILYSRLNLRLCIACLWLPERPRIGVWRRLPLRPAATGRFHDVADTGEGTSASDARWWAAERTGNRRVAAKYASGRQRRPLPLLTGPSIRAPWVRSEDQKLTSATSTWRPSSG